ncbi:MAG: hypothetical protein ACLFV7_00810 [Phycisphaerae bacterium]
MRQTMRRNSRPRRGVAYVMAIVLVTVMGSLAAFLITATDSGLQKSQNHRDVLVARNTAESGMGYLTYKLQNMAVPSDANATNVISKIATALAGEMNTHFGWAGGEGVSLSGSTCTIPDITLDGSTFRGSIALTGTDPEVRLQLTVTGESGVASKQMSTDFTLYGCGRSVFDYAVASKGTVKFGSNSLVKDDNGTMKADILAMQKVTDTVQVRGSANVEGQLYVTADKNALVSVGQGNGSKVCGVSDANVVMNQYVHEVEEPPFPTIDITQFTNAVSDWTVINKNTTFTGKSKGNKTDTTDGDTSTDTKKTGNDKEKTNNGGGNSKKNDSSDTSTDDSTEGETATSGDVGYLDANDNLVLENIMIEANSDIQFKQDTVIKGVVYIKAPNDIVFKSKVTIQGVIVTDDGSSNDQLIESTITFKGQASTGGIDALDTTQPQFAGLAGKTGTSILAPGFGLYFRGNSDSYQGTVAADTIEFRGNTSGGPGLNGSILGLNENFPIEMRGNSQLNVKRDDSSTTPPGFVMPPVTKKLVLDRDSYSEN